MIVVVKIFSLLFAVMEYDYMKARSADVLDISKRIINNLAGTQDASIKVKEPVILLADDLTPSETIQMDKSKILAFVTIHGSANSHTAILARSMNLPSIVGTDVELLEEYHGKMAVVDGFSGEFLIDPSEDVLQDMISRKNGWLDELEGLKKLVGQDNVTTDGRRVNVYCNIGNEEDAERVLAADGGGIGLFRSEFLYLGRDTAPTEEEQFKSYRTVLEKMGGKKEILDTRFNTYLEGGEEMAMIPRTSDGQLLFLLNNVSKMKKDTQLGSRIAEVHNGSAIFTGDAGSGESNARRYLIENDLVEAIISLPDNMFYNTGI